ncbi:radical SAM family heme chaperone HemW [Clostridium pasteurianum]|uniref:Heme chaperone HemW n=1 Tax=Clostridium pasteurianum BC1 TaxID=86416 RepID=R4K1V1_CLOPA|nr:radical SAM family heme chaperone HemW [Clostridium pasteurianum]AGK97067.1 putative oxygen-independent coproporphyrinogen III oxidase [Clostridium pasteurianum BC1]
MEETALYIHIPFCKQKCLYCDFPSFANSEELMTDYIRALSIEIRKLGNKKISTIFIGGGTPTYLNLEVLKILKKSLEELNLSKEIEFTIEGNPGTFTREKLKLLKDMGVNRLSIGLQAVQDELLEKLGRIHDFNTFLNSYNMARDMGFNNINVDLMFGLPGQDIEMWRHTLEIVINLNPEHLSCYSLIVEKGTPFFNLYSEEDLPDEDTVSEMYSLVKEFLSEKGYLQYEISNFSKNGLECKHNLVYWNLKNYIGVGSGAHSYYDGIRYRNEINVKRYVEAITKAGSAVVELHNNTLEDNMEEFMFLGLRKIKGISIEEFRQRFKKDIFSVYGDAIKKYKSNGMIILEKNRLYLSSRGIEISNYILSDFIIESSEIGKK